MLKDTDVLDDRNSAIGTSSEEEFEDVLSASDVSVCGRSGRRTASPCACKGSSITTSSGKRRRISASSSCKSGTTNKGIPEPPGQDWEEFARSGSEQRVSLGLAPNALAADERSVDELTALAKRELETIAHVAIKSTNLKGNYVKYLKDSSAAIKGIVDALQARTATEETARLRAENSHLQAQMSALEKEVAELRGLVARATVTPSPAPDPTHKSPRQPKPVTTTSSGVDQPFDPDEFRRSIMTSVGNMLTARLEGQEVERPRPPLGADKRAASSASASTTRQRMEPALKAQPKAAAPGKPAPSNGNQTKKGKGQNKKGGAKEAPKPAEPCPLPPAPASMDEGWSTVVKRGGKLKAMPQSTTGTTAQASKSKIKPASSKLRPPRSSAIVITLQPGADERGFNYKKVLEEAKQKIDLASCGIADTGLKFRKAATGARILEIPGATSGEKADSLAQKLREAIDAEVAKISRPTKSAEVRITGLDDSTSTEEVVAAVAQKGGCPAEAMKVGEIRYSPQGVGSVWVRCPVAAAKKLLEDGRLLIGWASVRVQLLEARALRCFRCLHKGHVRAQCTSEVDRSGECYRCGVSGHKAAGCTAAPSCSLCAAAGKPAGHKVGSKQCSPPKPKKGAVVTANKSAATDAPAASSSCPPCSVVLTRVDLEDGEDMVTST